jgi:hypothetical protein
MKRNRIAAIGSLVVSAGLMTAAAVGAAPAQADPSTDAFLDALTNAGLTGINPPDAIAVGQSVCPALVEPGQNLANVAAGVSNAIGQPLGPATMFTGLAIQIFCPGAVAGLINGQSPIPLPDLG